jgi:CheY-like chemotaxis protein
MLQQAARTGPNPPGGPSVPAGPLSRTDGQPTRVLIVEDEAFIALDLASMIEDLGGEAIASVTTADEAIAYAISAKPDVILMDIRLTRGDGIEAARSIRAQADIPLVFVTGNTDPETIRRFREFHDAPLVRKPIGVADLQDAILRVRRG